jgi:ArsR family transcriptional regulator
MKKVTQIFKALSDPTRVRIVWLLQFGGELCVCDLMSVLALPQSTVSRHLAYLRHAGLVNGQRKGIWMYYRLPEAPGQLLHQIMGIMQAVTREQELAVQDRQHLLQYLKIKGTDACAG